MVAYVQAFPIAELAFFIASLSLAGSITNVVNGALFTVGTATGLAASTIGEMTTPLN